MLLAKSKPERSLLLHTLDVVSMARQYAERWPHLAELAGDTALFDDLVLAALLHDLGKAAGGFQALLKGEPDESWQHYRHEILSAALTAILPYSHRRQDLLLAVMTHHMGMNDGDFRARSLSAYNPKYNSLTPFSERLEQLEPLWNELELLCGTLQGHAPEGMRLPKLPANPSTLPDPFAALQDSASNGRGRRERSRGRTSRPLPLRRIYLRGLLVGSDHLASAAITEENAQQENIVQSLPPLKSVGPFPFTLNQHQQVCAETQGSIFLNAPTGSGKTEAALLWSQANQSIQGSRHLFYILPFTASINAMYQRLKTPELFGDEAVSLLHGRSSYFAYRWLCERAVDPKSAAKQARAARRQTKELHYPVKVLTPYQILMAFLGVKGWEKSLCEYSGGLFILDEIHAYEPKLTGLLFEILRRLTQELGTKVCTMSATFPTLLKQALIEHTGKVTDIELDEHERDRYSRHFVRVAEGSIADYLPEIREKLAAGLRALVVCNTVAGAMAGFEALKGAAQNPCLIHGRLIHQDRQNAERRLAKGAVPEVDLLVGTQAIEVSLDIDFDVLYSDPAPLDALLQRFGRVNRKPLHELEALPAEERYRKVVVCREQYPDTPAIYDRDDGGRRLVKRSLEVLPSGAILQESTVGRLIDEVYDEKQLADFLKIAESKRAQLQRSVDALEPGNEKPYGEEDLLDELIDSIPLVPIRFFGEHQTCLREKRYFDAENYVFNIRKGRYHALKKQGKLYSEQEPSSGQKCLYGCFTYSGEIGPDYEIYQPPPTEIL